MPFEIIQNFNLSANEALDIRAVATSEADMLGIKWVYAGMAVVRTDTSPNKIFICNAAAATQAGPTTWTVIGDWEEFTGPAGTDGTNGSQIFVQSGAPGDVLGADGDFYIDSSSGDYYLKGDATPGEWGTAKGNTTGPQGPTGPAGADGDIYATVTDTDIDFTAAADPLTITVAQNLSWTVGQEVIVALQSDPLNVNLTGTVTSYLPGQATNNMVIESIVYTGTGSQTGQFDVNLTGAPGPKGDPGDPGDPANALIHTEADITLTQALIDDVVAGNPPYTTYTPQAPYSASVLNDNRANINTPAGIEGGMGKMVNGVPGDGKHSISFDGTNWSDNGIWGGDDGDDGYTPLHPVIIDGFWWVDNGAQTSTRINSNVAATGPQGDAATIVQEYHITLTSTTITAADVMSRGEVNYDEPCHIFFYIIPGATIYLPNLNNVAYQNTELRSISISMLSPRSGSISGLRSIKIDGNIVANNRMTYSPYQEVSANTPLYLTGTESATFYPVRISGVPQNYWNAKISGRGLSLSNDASKIRDLTAEHNSYLSGLNPSDGGVSGNLQGRYHFRAVDDVVHYGGVFKIKTAKSNGSTITDTFQLSEINSGFLPDPYAGPAWFTSSGLPSSNFWSMPLNITGVQQRFAVPFVGFSWIPYYSDEIAQARLIYDRTKLTAERLQLQVSIVSSSSHIDKLIHIGGSYLLASPYTSNLYYNQN